MRSAVVTHWPDAMLEDAGYEVHHPYAERFVLPVIGPTSLLLLRRLNLELAAAEYPASGVQLSLDELAMAIGLGHSASSLDRTVMRLERFGLLRTTLHKAITVPEQWLVRSHVAPITRTQLLRLPESLQLEHAELVRMKERPA